MSTQRGKFVVPSQSMIKPNRDPPTSLIQTSKHNQNPVRKNVDFTRRLSPQPHQRCGIDYSIKSRNKRGVSRKTVYFNSINLVRRNHGRLQHSSSQDVSTKTQAVLSSTQGVLSPTSDGETRTHSEVPCNADVYKFIPSPEDERKGKRMQKHSKPHKSQKKMVGFKHNLKELTPL